MEKSKDPRVLRASGTIKLSYSGEGASYKILLKDQFVYNKKKMQTRSYIELKEEEKKEKNSN